MDLWLRLVIGYSFSVILGHVAGGLVLYFFRLGPVNQSKNKKSVGDLMQFLSPRPFRGDNDTGTDYYGVAGSTTGFIERMMLTTLIIVGVDPTAVSALGFGWIGLKMTTYWIPLLSKGERKKGVYPPALGGLISITFAIVGGLMVTKWFVDC